jgi:hypothetical protein
VLRSDRNNQKSIGIPDGEMSPIYLGVSTNTEMGCRVCTYMVSPAENSIHAWGPMTNRKYVLGPGSNNVDIPLQPSDIWQLPFVAVTGSGCMFIVHRAFER